MKKSLVVACLMLFGCETEIIKGELVLPSEYNGENYLLNTEDELEARASLKSLSGEIKKGRNGIKVEQEIAIQYLNELRPLTTDYYFKLIEKQLLPELFTANTGKPLKLGLEGGLYSAFLFNKYGIENEQLIEKGLYAAAFYNAAYKLVVETRDTKTTDKVVALFGAHPDFANSNNSNLHVNADTFIANYIARRDANNGAGFYTNIQNGLIKLQAAINGGSIYTKEQEEAIEVIFTNWEKGNAATAINYIYGVLSKLSSTNPDESTKASAMHSLSEVLGFLHGFREVNGKIITDQEIDGLLMLLNVPVGETPKTENFLNQPAEELPKIVLVLDKLQVIYGFSQNEMEDFKKNWVSEQNR
jgi:hypothetical protein